MSGIHLLQIHPGAVQEPRFLEWYQQGLAEKRILGTWTTCMRHLVFTHCDHHVTQDVLSLQCVSGFKYVSSEGVFRYLLEIVCGLQSAVIGETEIQGQFRKFLEKEVNDINRPLAMYRPMFNELIAKAKVIREKHLRELGSQSYPSIVRKICQNDKELSFLGAGQMVEEILPWIKNKSVRVYNRSLKRFAFENVDTHLLDVDLAGEVLLIAAPMKNEEILRLADRKFRTVIDFRGEEKFKVLPNGWNNYFHLEQLAAQLEKDRGKVQEKVSSAMVDITAFASEFSNKMIIRPQGWDDLWR